MIFQHELFLYMGQCSNQGESLSFNIYHFFTLKTFEILFSLSQINTTSPGVTLWNLRERHTGEYEAFYATIGIRGSRGSRLHRNEISKKPKPHAMWVLNLATHRKVNIDTDGDMDLGTGLPQAKSGKIETF